MISILTPTIPERVAMLNRCHESVVQLASHLTWEHIIVSDGPHPGWTPRSGGTFYQLQARTGGPAAPVMVANYLARGDWRIILPDDDYLVPGGLEDLYAEVLNSGCDFVYGQQGLTASNGDGHVYKWNGRYPLAPGESGGFLFHKRLLAIAHLEQESAFEHPPAEYPEAGNDWPLLQKWVEGGAKYAYYPIHLLIHREG